MPTNVLMPQLGESITEGTIVRWIKKVGDTVNRDEPLFEISTDKVDAEIPSPAAGILSEIRASAEETVAVDSIVAVITVVGDEPQPSNSKSNTSEKYSSYSTLKANVSKRMETAKTESRIKVSSPFVRRLAREKNIDITKIKGSGIDGRVTKEDILNQIDSPSTTVDQSDPLSLIDNVQVVPMTIMRQKISERMIESQRISAHVHSVFEVDFSRIEEIRKAKQSSTNPAGSKLTQLAFIAKSVVDAIKAVPVVNASIDGDQMILHKDVNLGIAVSLDWGLIVPVIKEADQMDVSDLSSAIADLAERARTKQLRPEEVEGGTFTITNAGTSGSLLGMPIINQPQVAILCVGAIEKRPVVFDNAVVVRSRAYLTLGFDHRLIDGSVADRFLSRIKVQLENFDAPVV